MSKRNYIGFAVLLALALPDTAAAAPTIGASLSIFAQVIGPLITLTAVMSTVVGAYLLFNGLKSFADASSSRGQVTFNDGFAKLIGAVLLISIPETLGIGVTSLFGATYDTRVYDGSYEYGGVTSCISGGGMILSCMANNIATNVVPVFLKVAFALMFLSGAALAAQTIYKMATQHGNGQRGHERGLVLKLLIAIVLANSPVFLGQMSETFGITGGTLSAIGTINSSSSLLAYNAPAGMLSQYASLIASLFRIFVMFGVIAVWRGLFLLKAGAEGSQQGAAGAGAWHIIGGVFLVNIKFTVCLVLNTTAGGGGTMGFC